MDKTNINLEMCEAHKHHIRGDMASGTGFAYECLWRCRLMLRLNPLDTISIYEGEDALIKKENGEKIYYQIKRTNFYWKLSNIKSFLQRAEKMLKDDPRIFCVLSTNANLAYNALSEFQKIRQKSGTRFKIERWELDPTYPLERIKNDIYHALENYFQPYDISSVINFDQINICLNKLLAFEAELKLKEINSIRGDQVWERSGLKQLAEKIPSLVLGERLRPWSRWIDEASTQDVDPFLSNIRKIAIDHRSAQLKDMESEAFKLVSQWKEDPFETRFLLIQGVSGTGKTWLLIKLGMYLSKHFLVYCDDEYSTGDYPELNVLSSFEKKAMVVLIDNLIEVDWHRHIIKALKSQLPILIIGTTSMSLHHSNIILLRKRFGAQFICLKLEPLLTQNDLMELIDYFRKGIVSRKEQASLMNSNVRYAARFLEGQESEEDLVNRLYNELWIKDERQDWVTPVLLCSSLNVKIPRLVLRNYTSYKPKATKEIPNKLWQLTLHARRKDDIILWLEDPEIAHKLFDIITEKNMDKKTIESSFFETTKDLVNNIHVDYASHRQFARRILSRFCDRYPHYQELLLENCEDMISKLLDREPRWCLAYIWLPLLPQAERVKVARKAAQKFLYESPQSMADIILLTEAIGNEHARHIISQELQNTRGWDINPWAVFIEHLIPLDNYSQKELLRRSIHYLQYGIIDLQQLLKTRKIAEHLIALTEKYGLPGHREWLMNVLKEMLPESPDEETLKRHNLITQYLKLTNRCIMQPRSGLSLVITKELVSAPHQHERKLQRIYREIYDTYRNIYREEVKNGYHTIALRCAFNFAKALSIDPPKANLLWTATLSFSKQWATLEEKKQIDRQVTTFLKKTLEQKLPIRLVKTTVLEYARILTSGNGISDSKIRVILETLIKGMKSDITFQLFLLLTTMIAIQTHFRNFLSKQAKQVLITLIYNFSDEAKNSCEDFLKTLGKIVGVSEAEDFVLPFIPELENWKNEIVIELLSCLGKIQWDDIEKKRLIDAIYMHWLENTVVRRNVILTLLNLNGIQQAKEILEMMLMESTDDPDILFLACSCEARLGNSQQAKNYMVNATRLYERKVIGGHLQNISRAFFYLSRCSETPEKEIFELCSSLVSPGPLKPIEEVLHIA